MEHNIDDIPVASRSVPADRAIACLLVLGFAGLNPTFRAAALGKIQNSKHQIPNKSKNSKTNVPNDE
jgi:hypothetical protein